MKYIFLSFALLVTACLSAQNTTGHVRWKSASNIYYNYTGELKNGKPHGRGFAISEDKGDAWIQVFGEFKDGMIDGSTVIRQSSGRIVVAKWKQNKPEGTGVIITPDENIDYGDFVNGKMEDRVISIHWDNKIVIKNVKNGETNGRAIVISPDGKSIADRIYINDTANGPGYLYEIDKKQLFEGIWEKGEWVKASTVNYPSFMRNSKLGSGVTADYIYISSDFAKQDNREQFHDTCFYYELKNNRRWFGAWDRGQFRSGVRLNGDSLRIIGQSDEKGFSQGFCVEYKKGRYLNIANYKDDKLDGNGITIDIDDSTIYDGFLSENSFTGNAARLMKNKEIRAGNFSKGSMEGGKIIYPDGHAITEEYSTEFGFGISIVKEIILPDGQKINPRPKEVCTAINFLLKEWESNFSNINKGKQTESISGYESWYNLARGNSSYIIPDKEGIDGKPHHEFSAEIVEHNRYDMITSSYNELCKELSVCFITSLAKGKSFKLTPKINKLPDDGAFERIASFFTIPAYPGKKHDPQIRVMVENKDAGIYTLTLDIISKWK